jgi:hypothetical protein
LTSDTAFSVSVFGSDTVAMPVLPYGFTPFQPVASKGAERLVSSNVESCFRF